MGHLKGCVVDQDVDATELFDGFLDDVPAVLFVFKTLREVKKTTPQ